MNCLFIIDFVIIELGRLGQWIVILIINSEILWYGFSNVA